MNPCERDEKGQFLPRHGGYGTKARARYTDRRHKEGKQLHQILSGIVEDLGGMEKLNAGQRLLLDTLRSKLIVVLQVGKWVDLQPSIIKDGEVLPCLGKNYLAYTNAIRLIIAELYKDNDKGKGGYKGARKEILGCE